MKPTASTTSIYLACFRSASHQTLDGASGQYLVVEQAIRDGEWPYDNGDDPSFYVARRGGLLTWGICRQDLRNAIEKDNIVVFFSFTPESDRTVLYRLCAVATVADKVDHRAVHRDGRFAQVRDRYINGLIVPERGGWHYDETDRPLPQRHDDTWLWRMADHRGITKEEFEKKHAGIYKSDWFSDGAVRLACNYVVFSHEPDRTFIAPNPPLVAVTRNGQYERWLNKRLRASTLDTAASWGERRHLLNRYRPHRQVRFDMPTGEAMEWRHSLTACLRKEARRVRTASIPAKQGGRAVGFRCGG